MSLILSSLFKYPKRFASWLEGIVSGCTVPPHNGVRNEVVETSFGNDGYVISYIPKSDMAPHQVAIKGKGELRYYIRAGSDFVPTGHAVLAGLFGRRSQPSIAYQYVVPPAEVVKLRSISKFKVNIPLQINIMNNGPGIAKDGFLNINVYSKPDNQMKLIIEEPDSRIWRANHTFNLHFSIISSNDFRLPPNAFIVPIHLNFEVELPIKNTFANPLKIKGSCGCSQAPIKQFSIENDGKSIENLLNFTRL